MPINYNNWNIALHGKWRFCWRRSQTIDQGQLRPQGNVGICGRPVIDDVRNDSVAHKLID